MSRNDRSDANFDMARDELFSHIHRCGVLRSTQEQQEEWMADTVQYMAERFPELSADPMAGYRQSVDIRDAVQPDCSGPHEVAQA